MARELHSLSHQANMDGIRIGAHIGDRVSFRISDVYLPEPLDVLAQLTSEVEAVGVIVEFSDSGSLPQAYAVVRLGPHQSVLLPVAALGVVARRHGHE